MAIDLNNDSTINSNGGGIKGEDKYGTDTTHEDQLSIRHTETSGDPLTIIIGNAVEGVDHGSGANDPEEDIRPARVWIVPDAWGDKNNSGSGSNGHKNNNWPDWWLMSGAYGGWGWRAFDPDPSSNKSNNFVTPGDVFKNALSVDMISNIVNKDYSRVPDEFSDNLSSHGYAARIHNRVYVDEERNGGEVGGLITLVTIEDVGTNKKGHVTDCGAYLGAISIRAPLNHESIDWPTDSTTNDPPVGSINTGDNKGSLFPYYATYWSSLGHVGDQTNPNVDQPSIRTVFGYLADFVQSVAPLGTHEESMVRYCVGYVCHLADGTGFGDTDNGDYENNGFTAGYMVDNHKDHAIGVHSTNKGNRRVYGFNIRDLGTGGLGTTGTDPRVFGDLIGLKVDDQNTGTGTTSECNIWGVKIGDLKNTNVTTTYPAIASGVHGIEIGDITTKYMDAFGLLIGNVEMESGGTASEVLSIKTEGGDIHFNGTGAALATVDAKIGDSDNRGRLTVSVEDDWAKDKAFKPFVLVEGELELDTPLNAAGILNTPTAPSLTSGHAHEVLGTVSSVYTSSNTTIKSDALGGASADPYAMISGFLGGILLKDSPTVNSGSVMAGVYAYILDNGSANPAVDDMAALVGDYPAVVDIGDLEGTGSIKSAFGLYTLEPDPGNSSAGTAAAVFDGDVVVGQDYDSNQSKIYLNGDSKWRTSSSMTKGSATIGYASSRTELDGANVKVGDTHYFLPPSSAAGSAPANSVYVDSTSGKLVFYDGTTHHPISP